MSIAKTITIISGSTRNTSTGKAITKVVEEFLSKKNDIKFQEFTPIAPFNLLNTPINDKAPMMIKVHEDPKAIDEYESEIVRNFSKAITASDGFIFILPVYNHSYPGGFKIMMDHIFHEFKGKPVYIVGYGPGAPDAVIVETTNLLNKFGLDILASTPIKLSYTNPDYLTDYKQDLENGVNTLLKTL